MDVTLVVNPRAGEAEHETEDLVAALSRRGDAVQVVKKASRLFGVTLHEHPGDLVVVAGGDGTVAAVARQLRGTTTPVLIIPVGTANNIARSFGIQKPQLDLDVVRRWRKQPVDAAEIEDELIIESAGCGAVAHMIRESPDRDALPSFEYEIRMESESRRGEAILIEVMAIARAGPRLLLSPDGDPADGLLDLVIATPKSRNAVRSALHSSGRRKIDGLTVMQGREFTITAETRWHFDDKAKRGRTHTIRIVPKAWTVLAP